MKRAILFILTIVLILTITVEFDPGRSLVSTASGQKIRLYILDPSKDGVKAFKVLFAKQDLKDNLKSCFNVTPIEFSEKYDFKLFRGGSSKNNTYLLYEGHIVFISGGYGSTGATTFAVSDVNEDGNDELYFAESCGSGRIRSTIGYFDFGTGEVRSFELLNFADYLAVGLDSGGRVVVCNASVSPYYLDAEYIYSYRSIPLLSVFLGVRRISLDQIGAYVTCQSGKIDLEYCDTEWLEERDDDMLSGLIVSEQGDAND
jgi:hypothetical protein